jgi:2-iminobutanoate/2-iminopropanoate deaminase
MQATDVLLTRLAGASLVSAALLGGCDRAPAAKRELTFVPMAENPALPFSAAVRVGDMLYLSGQIGTDSTGRLVRGGIGPETRQTMENIKRVVEQHGSSMGRVVKCLVMLADMTEWSAMNETYVRYFTDHLPARSAMGASGLALGARVEIECLAAL